MHQERLRTRIAEAIETAVGGRIAVHVRADGFRALPRKRAVARCLGATGTVLEIALDGWGAAFERRRSTMQVVIDVGTSMERALQTALSQAASSIRLQSSRAALAAAWGIAGPLDVEGFQDLGRLRIDVASAHALLEACGSDVAVCDWVRRQLQVFHSGLPGTRAERVIDVRGTEVRIPFALLPLHRIGSASERHGPTWDGTEVMIPVSEAATPDGAQRLAQVLLADTPAAKRQIVFCDGYPSADVLDAVRRTEMRLAGSGRGRVLDTRQRAWRLLLEGHPVPVLEAFG